MLLRIIISPCMQCRNCGILFYFFTFALLCRIGMASFTDARLTVAAPKKLLTSIAVKILLLTILFPKATFMATLGTAQIDGK